MKNCSSFVKISKCSYDKKENVYKFYDNNGLLLHQTKNVYYIKDPTFDKTFKSLFSDSPKFDDVDCCQRSINLINSLLYPDAKDKQFTTIEFLKNESIIGNKSFIFDILCKCSRKEKYQDVYYKENVDLEMQKSKKSQEELLERFFKYGICLFLNSNDIDDKQSVLVFVDSKSVFRGSQSLKFYLENDENK